MTEDTTPAEHPKTDALRAMGKYPLPRNVAEMLWIAAAEIDRLRAALSAVGVGAAPAETTHGHRFNPDERHKDECRECWQQRVDPVHVQQPAEHVFIQREDDLTDPWCMCCDAVKRPSAGAGSPSTPTPAEVPPICDFCRPHEFVPFSEDWTSPDSECEWCGAERREAVHVQRGDQ